jgi:DNA invertase Pin-like site-specific DNA recombinase
LEWDLIPAGHAERDIHIEQASSVRERPELDLLRRRILRPGDDLVVTRLDRLARSARDMLAIAEAAAGCPRTEIASALDIGERSVYRILAETRPKTD